MFAERLISHELFPLKRTDSCETAVMFMHDWGVAHLPVVENNMVIGYVTLQDAVNSKKAEKVSICIKNDKLITAFDHQHIFELMRIFDETGLSTLSVVGKENNFLGILSVKELVKALYRDSSLSQIGGIITLEMQAKDYSLAELSRIVEYNDVKIIHVYIYTISPENNTILISLKFNQPELKNVIASLERHGKLIRSVHQATSNDDTDSNRYDWLIKYLNT